MQYVRFFKFGQCRRSYFAFSLSSMTDSIKGIDVPIADIWVVSFSLFPMIWSVWLRPYLSLQASTSSFLNVQESLIQKLLPHISQKYYLYDNSVATVFTSRYDVSHFLFLPNCLARTSDSKSLEHGAGNILYSAGSCFNPFRQGDHLWRSCEGLAYLTQSNRPGENCPFPLTKRDHPIQQ